MPGYDPNKAQKLASQCPDDSGSLISAGNKCSVNSSYELDASVKQSLDLDESFKIDDTDDISNTIQTKLDQANFASCSASSTAENQIALQKVKCKDMKISDIEQQAIAKLYLTCVFNQENVSEISNKIANKIAKKYNQIYDAVQKKGADKDPDWLANKLKIVDALAAAGVEQIMAAAGDLPPAPPVSAPPTPDSGKTQSQTTENKSDSSKSGGPVSDALPTIGPSQNDTQPINFSKPVTQPDTTQSQPAPVSQPQLPMSQPPAPVPVTQPDTTQPQSTPMSQPEQNSVVKSLVSNPYILYGGIGLIVLIIFLIIVLATSGSSDSSSE
jgi:hypothetical protein